MRDIDIEEDQRGVRWDDIARIAGNNWITEAQARQKWRSLRVLYINNMVPAS